MTAAPSSPRFRPESTRCVSIGSRCRTQCRDWRACDFADLLPPLTGGRSATSSPELSLVSALAYCWLTAVATDGSKFFRVAIRRSYSSSTSATVAESASSRDSSLFPTRSFNIPKNRTRTRIGSGQLSVASCQFTASYELYADGTQDRRQFTAIIGQAPL